MSIESIVAAGKRLIETTLLDAAIIGHRSLVPDTSGGRTITYTDDLFATPARYGTLIDPHPQETVDSVFGAATGQVMMPLGTVVAEGDRITNPADGQKWLVVGDKTATSKLSVVQRVLIREF